MNQVIDDILAGLRAGRLAPYLGPGVTALAEGAPVPASPADLAAFLGKRVALPKRARGNPWAAAQYIESNRHRSTLTALMDAAYADPVPPGDLHRMLAGIRPPLIVDTWYDGAMRAALVENGSGHRGAEDRGAEDWGAEDWGEIQGITRAGIGEARWYRAYAADGTEVPVDQAASWRTILYKPHGGVTPARNYIIADSDYVEVLTEIDIQTPIPDIVRQRRTACGFVFVGCRFDDQMLRTYARQIMKRSAGPHYAFIEPALLSRNEQRFLDEMHIQPVSISLPAISALLAA
jgi:SIR2-like domain